MTTAGQTPTKGAGTTFERLKTGESISSPADYYNDDKWDVLGGLIDLSPGEITVEAQDENYLDDPEAEWGNTTPGQKTMGETTITILWKPGDPTQKAIVEGVNNDEITHYRSKYPNGLVDAMRGYVSGLGKVVTIKDKMQRNIKFQPVGKPVLAETNPAPAA